MNKTKIIALGIIAFLLIVIMGLIWNIGRNQKPSDEIVNKLTDSFGNSQNSIDTSSPDFGSAGPASLPNSLQSSASSSTNIQFTNSLNFSSGRLDQSFLASQNSSSSAGTTISQSVSFISEPISFQSPLAQKIANRRDDTVNFGQFKIGQITYQANLQIAPDGSSTIKISSPDSQIITVGSAKLTNIFIETIENTSENGVFLLTQRLGNGVRISTATYQIDLKKAVDNPNAEVILEN